MESKPTADNNEFPELTYFLGDIMPNGEVYGGDQFTPKKIIPRAKVIPVVEAPPKPNKAVSGNEEAKQPERNEPIKFPWFEEMLKKTNPNEM